MDYLVEEVLKQQRPDVRDFLLTTSVLEKLSAPLCDAVTGRGDSQDVLVRLESSFGGFLVPLDESRQWYRYHHLFGDLLRHQLEMERNQDRLHKRTRAPDFSMMPYVTPSRPKISRQRQGLSVTWLAG
jgi:LuxR family maltose regulon positive regulatory protein